MIIAITFFVISFSFMNVFRGKKAWILNENMIKLKIGGSRGVVKTLEIFST